MKVITIGRAPDNDVVIDDQQVSRIHLQLILKDNGSVSIVDVGSANGTYVNGEKISGERILSKDDVVVIGSTTLPWEKYAGIKRKKTIVVMIIVIFLALIAIGAIILFTMYSRSDNQKADEYNEWQQDSIKIAELQNEAAELYQKALETQSKEAMEKALQKQEEAEAALTKVREAEQERNAAIDIANAAEQARRNAEKDAEEAERAKSRAEIKAAETNALLEEVLNDIYRRTFNGLKKNKKKLEYVAERISQSASDTLPDPELFIESEYKKGGFDRKREIINIMQKVTESGNEVRPDPTDSTKTRSDEK